MVTESVLDARIRKLHNIDYTVPEILIKLKADNVDDGATIDYITDFIRDELSSDKTSDEDIDKIILKSVIQLSVMVDKILSGFGKKSKIDDNKTQLLVKYMDILPKLQKSNYDTSPEKKKLPSGMQLAKR